MIVSWLAGFRSFSTAPDQASTPEEARGLLMKTVEDVNPSEISFTERAAMRTQCRKLAKFMKVVGSTWYLCI